MPTSVIGGLGAPERLAILSGSELDEFVVEQQEYEQRMREFQEEKREHEQWMKEFEEVKGKVKEN